jgi:hypothetical protein
MPWEIEGISMGKVAKTAKRPLNFILVLVTQKAKAYAVIIEITVPAPLAIRE